MASELELHTNGTESEIEETYLYKHQVKWCLNETHVGGDESINSCNLQYKKLELELHIGDTEWAVRDTVNLIYPASIHVLNKNKEIKV